MQSSLSLLGEVVVFSVSIGLLGIFHNHLWQIALHYSEKRKEDCAHLFFHSNFPHSFSLAAVAYRKIELEFEENVCKFFSPFIRTKNELASIRSFNATWSLRLPLD